MFVVVKGMTEADIIDINHQNEIIYEPVYR